MNRPTRRLTPTLLLLAVAAATVEPIKAPIGAIGYAATDARSTDTLRLRYRRQARQRYPSLVLGTAVSGFLSVRGLPPLAGTMVLIEGGLLFRSTDGRVATTYPLVGPQRQRAGQRWRAPAVTLAYVDLNQGHQAYLFRVEGGVFETEAPGPLLDLAERPRWLDSLRSTEWTVQPPLVDPADSEAIRKLTTAMERSEYADTLYSLFGRPQRSAGQVGELGRRAGRLGEYIANRDSLALDPARMTSTEQLRHAFAHELGHRWQARSPRQLELLWQGVGPIKDSKRYGYGSTAEHQAEAIAFAVHFLQTTSGRFAPGDALALLDHYELLVPGTSTMTRYLALQPVYTGHPLRRLLLTGSR